MSEQETVTPILDLHVIGQLKSIDPTGERMLLERLVSFYLESALSVVQELHQDLTNGDQEHLMHLVHRFKTTNANLGLRRMYEVLCRLEKEDLTFDEQHQLMAQLDEEVLKSLDSLQELVCTLAKNPTLLHLES